jgi:hypothetical protein
MSKGKTHEFVVSFGKHRGKTLDQIADEDVSYILWLDSAGVLKIEEEFLDTCGESVRLQELYSMTEWQIKYM